VRAQGVEAHVSVGAVLVIAYVLAFLMWRTTPERTEAFVKSGGAGGRPLATATLSPALRLALEVPAHEDEAGAHEEDGSAHP